uniref:GSK-3-binding protein n=1 Tax=Leptobrachium leishanense TaxID=445787 RepID=A0A8C5PRS0_9ANUR
MPCRKESFLLLEQSVTVGSKEVDTLVARIGEALQLNAQRAPSSTCGMGYQGYGTLRPPTKPPGHCSCVRGRATPYPVCTPRGGGRVSRHQDSGAASKQLCGRGWIRGGCRKHGQQDEEDEDPHQLLQELLLNGNLIKEAVRRLHMAAERPPEPAETTVP